MMQGTLPAGCQTQVASLEELVNDENRLAEMVQIVNNEKLDSAEKL